MSEHFKRICEFFEKENIDTFAILRREQVSVINERLMPENAKSVIMFLIPYYTGEHKDRNVSLYAVSRDYHLYIKQLQSRFCEKDGFYRFFSDNSPIDERLAALNAGLGIKGQNRLLVNQKYGTYFFIASIITDIEFDSDEYVGLLQHKECKKCGLCQKACAFLRGEREYCLSELNQRKKVTDEELSVIHSQNIIWGCDICQQVCPYNKDIPITPVEFFHKDKIPVISTELIEKMSDEEFSQRAYSWRGKNVLLRNLSKNSEAQ